jgi:hypothetical protein
MYCYSPSDKNNLFTDDLQPWEELGKEVGGTINCVCSVTLRPFIKCIQEIGANLKKERQVWGDVTWSPWAWVCMKATFLYMLIIRNAGTCPASLLCKSNADWSRCFLYGFIKSSNVTNCLAPDLFSSKSLCNNEVYRRLFNCNLDLDILHDVSIIVMQD